MTAFTGSDDLDGATFTNVSMRGALEGSCAATLDRVEAMPEGTVDISVAGEWSFAQTLRHLVLATERKNPHAPEYPESTLSCLHTILEEEWENHRYAVRDLDAIGAQSAEK